MVPVPARVAVAALGGAHEREPRLPHHDLRIPPRGGNPEVQPRGDLRGRDRLGKERVSTVWARRRKYLRERPREERLNLVLCPAHRGGRRDDLRPHCAAGDLAHAERFDRRFIETGHRAEGTRNQVQLVLDHEVGRGERRSEARTLPRLRSPVEPGRIGPVRPPEQRARRPDPRQRGELIHCRDHKRRQPPVERLIYGNDRERAVTRKVALEVRADDPQLAWLIIIGQEREGVRPEACPTPGAVFERNR